MTYIVYSLHRQTFTRVYLHFMNQSSLVTHILEWVIFVNCTELLHFSKINLDDKLAGMLASFLVQYTDHSVCSSAKMFLHCKVNTNGSTLFLYLKRTLYFRTPGTAFLCVIDGRNGHCIIKGTSAGG